MSDDRGLPLGAAAVRTWYAELLLGVAITIGVATIGLAVVQPFQAGPVGFDTAASILHFQHLMAGRHMEAFVTTTPKPLLTLVDGILYSLDPDWRLISIATIVAFSISVALTAHVARRVAGVGAAAFAVIGLVAAASLMAELVYAYAVPWAMLGWASAAVFTLRPQPRYGWAGLALMLATLARFETIVIVGLALVVLVSLQVAHVMLGRPAPPRRAWLILLGFVALPIMCLHDLLITGDPLFWSTVAQLASPPDQPGPYQVARRILIRYRRELLLSLLAIVGGLYLLRKREWPLALGLVGLGPGIGVLLLMLASRGTYISTRYYTAIDVAVITAAAIGAGALTAWLVGRLLAWRGSTRLRAAATIGACVLLALAAQPAPAPLASSTRNLAAQQRQFALHAERAVPILQTALKGIPGSFALPGTIGAADPTANGRQPVLRIPTLLRPRLAVDLALPISNLSSLSAAMLLPGDAFLHCARLAYHDRLGDLPVDGYRVLEVSSPTSVGSDTISPLLSDPADGVWIVLVERSSSGSACAGP